MTNHQITKKKAQELPQWASEFQVFKNLNLNQIATRCSPEAWKINMDQVSQVTKPLVAWFEWLEDFLPATVSQFKMHNCILRLLLLVLNHKIFTPSHTARNIRFTDKKYFEGNNGASSSFLLPPVEWNPPSSWSREHGTFLQKDIQLISTEGFQLFLWLVLLH